MDNLVAKRKTEPYLHNDPGGYSWKFLVGVCRPVLQILTLFQTKKMSFSHSFSDLAL